MKKILPKMKKLRKAITVAASSREEIELEAEAEGEEGDWAWLPCNVQDLILDKLVSLADYIRYGAVCKSWLKIFRENCNHRRHSQDARSNNQLPLLMMPHRFDENKACFYSVTHEQNLKFELSLPYHQRFIGSSFGCLISVKSDFSITVFNPFVTAPTNYKWRDNSFDLSSLDDIPFNHEYYIIKAVLSADPNWRPYDDALMIIYGECRRIAFIRSQESISDEQWFYLWPDVKGFCDIMFSDDAFYALRGDGQVWIFEPRADDDQFWSLEPPEDEDEDEDGDGDGDDDDDGDEVDEDIKDALTISPPLTSNGSCFARYIVKGAGGEILQVLRYGEPSLVGFPSCSTSDFQVFKLDRCHENCDWVELKSLGDQVLFVGDNASLSVIASDFPGCQPGAIYYSFGYHPEILNMKLSDDITGTFIDTGLFNLENRTFRPHNIAYDHALRYAMHQFPPIWVVPSVQKLKNSSAVLKS